LTLLRSLFTASNTVCGIDGVTGGLFVPDLPVALGSFSVAVDALVEPAVEPVAFVVLADAVFVLGFAFAVAFFATGFFAVVFFVVGFFVIFAIFFSHLCFTYDYSRLYGWVIKNGV
jgi:hypothetical protein